MRSATALGDEAPDAEIGVLPEAAHGAASTSGPSRAELPGDSGDERLAFMVQRLRIALIGLTAPIAVFAVADLVRGTAPFAQLAPFKALQILGVVGGWIALRRPAGQRGAVGISLFVAACFFAGVSGQAVVRHDLVTAAISLLATVYIGAVLLPAGVGAQAVLTGLAALAMLAAVYGVTGDLARACVFEALPLWISGAFSVVIAYQWQGHRAVVDRQRRALEASRRQLAALLEVARERAEESEALARVGREMIGSLQAPAMLERLCQLTAEILRGDFSHTFLHRPENDTFVVVAGFGDRPDQLDALRVLAIPRAVVAELVEVLEAGKVVQVGRDRRADLLAARMQPSVGVAHSMLVPLRRAERLVGVLSVGFRQRTEPFSPRAERIAAGIAHIASLALDNALLVEEVNRANAIKGEFVATMSHELRSPLNILIGYSDLLLDGAFDALGPSQAAIVQRLREQSQELLSMINATLDLSRLEEGRVPVQVDAVEAAALLAELEQETLMVKRRDGVQLEWMVGTRLPVLRTDPTKLKVVVGNLVRNAIKFTEHGRITVAARAIADGIEFSVTDTGIGIPAESRERIFEPFRQADASIGARFGGAGLGLHIVRRMVDLLGGSIGVDSEPGRGSTFRVWLPLVAEAARPIEGRG